MLGTRVSRSVVRQVRRGVAAAGLLLALPGFAGDRALWDELDLLNARPLVAPAAPAAAQAGALADGYAGGDLRDNAKNLFQVSRFEVSGVAPNLGVELASVLQYYMGRSINYTDLLIAKERIREVYRQRGQKVDVALPRQSTPEGVVSLQISVTSMPARRTGHSAPPAFDELKLRDLLERGQRA